MYFSVPECKDIKDEAGELYTIYTIAINGANHCSVRFSQLKDLNDQLIKEFGAKTVPTFPAKKVFALNDVEKEDRKYQLESYFQKISQNHQILTSSLIISFFSSAQKETEKDDEIEVEVTIFLMNLEKITIHVNSYDQTEDILQKCMETVHLDSSFFYYFGLFMVKKSVKDTIEIIRQLQDFESPYISLKEANKKERHRLLLRKSTFDLNLDDKLFEDKVALNLMYIQAVSELEWGWIKPSAEALQKLEHLQEANSKKEFLALVRSQRFYGYIHLRSCVVDYPEENTKAHISIGENNLNFSFSDKNIKDIILKITRIRCWKILSTANESQKLQFSFEYMVKKNAFVWIRLESDQSILLSMCMQAMIDEILAKKSGKNFGESRSKAEKLPFMTRQKKLINKDTHGVTDIPQQQHGENDLFENENFISNDDL